MKHLLAIFGSAWLAIALPVSAYGQLETNPTPMWEGVEKSDADKESDANLVKSALELTNGDRRAATISMLRIGWDKIAKGQANEAIRSFNQAWLIEPEFSDIYWGFAVATHIRGDDLKKVMQHFDRAAKDNERDPRLATDRGRVLEQRNETEEARVWFERAIEMDETYAPAYIGMILVARKLEDETLEAEFQKKHDELTGKSD